jgi:hypothetical protein
MKKTTLLLFFIHIGISAIAQDTITISKLCLSPECLWGEGYEQKSERKYIYNSENKWVKHYPILYEDEYEIVFIENMPVRTQNFIEGAIDTNFISNLFKVHNPKEFSQTWLKKDYDAVGVTYYELKQRWGFDTKTQKITLKVEGINPKLVETVGFDLKDFSEFYGYNDKKTWLPLTGKKELKPKEITNSIIICEEVSLSDELTKKLVNSKHTLSHPQKVWLEDTIRYYSQDTIETYNLIDTIITFDPETFKQFERVDTFNRIVSSKYFNYVILYEMKFSERGTVESNILAVRPVHIVFDDRGNFRYKLYTYTTIYDKKAIKYLEQEDVYKRIRFEKSKAKGFRELKKNDKNK